MKLFATIKESASYFGLSYNYVYSLVKSGTIRSTRSGKKYYINVKDLCNYLGSEFVE